MTGVQTCALPIYGPLFKGKRVAVIGGGNSGVEAAIDLAGLVAHVTLIEFDSKMRADAVLQDRLRSLANVAIANTLIAVAGALAPGYVREVLGFGERSVAVRVPGPDTGPSSAHAASAASARTKGKLGRRMGSGRAVDGPR